MIHQQITSFEQLARSNFERMDKDNDNALTWQEVSQYKGTEETPVSEEAAKKFLLIGMAHASHSSLQAPSVDFDDKINLQEFMALLRTSMEPRGM